MYGRFQFLGIGVGVFSRPADHNIIGKYSAQAKKLRISEDMIAAKTPAVNKPVSNGSPTSIFNMPTTQQGAELREGEDTAHEPISTQGTIQS